MNQRKTTLIYGLGAGIFMISGWMVSNIFLVDENGNWDFGKSEIAGYAAMILSLSTIIIGVKKYRDKEKGGYISFKEAFLTGLYIVLITSSVYVIGWMIYYPTITPSFGDQYMSYQLETWKESGLSSEEITLKKADLKSQFEAYKNPFVRIGLTFLEVFPIGLVIAAISALILKKKRKE